MSNTFVVPKIQSDAVASAETLNAPLNYIQSSLNGLAESTGTRSANIQYQVPVDSTVNVGDLVYFNSNTSKFEKAIAGILSNSSGIDGQAIQAESCHVQGFILSINTTQHSAVMLRSGYCSNSSIANTLGNGAEAGLYYLSTETAGKATKLPGWDVRVPCINYYGNGKFSFIPFCSSYVGQGAPVVRKIASNNLDITTGNYGSVIVDQKSYSNVDTQLSATAIASITDLNRTVSTPVISALMAGPGMIASYKGYGVWKLSLSNLIGKPVPATDFTLNGTLRASQGYLTYTVFPKRAKTYMTMLLTVPADVEATPISSIKIWMNTRGPGGCRYTAKLYWLPYSEIGDSTTIPTQFSSTTITAINTSTTQLCYYESAQVEADITTQGVLVAEISTQGNSNDCYVHQAGFIFNSSQAESNSGSSSGESEVINRQTIMAILKEVLSYNPTYIEN